MSTIFLRRPPGDEDILLTSAEPWAMRKKASPSSFSRTIFSPATVHSSHIGSHIGSHAMATAGGGDGDGAGGRGDGEGGGGGGCGGGHGGGGEGEGDGAVLAKL